MAQAPQPISENGNAAPDAQSDAGVDRVFGGRYRALRTLKQSRGTETFLATDLSQGHEVVVKEVSARFFSAGTRMLAARTGQFLKE